eukprot:900685-Pelagomonas_calceolata.AAC.4
MGIRPDRTHRQMRTLWVLHQGGHTQHIVPKHRLETVKVQWEAGQTNDMWFPLVGCTMSDSMQVHPYASQNERLPPSFLLHPHDFTGVLMALEVGNQLRWAIVPPSLFFRQREDQSHHVSITVLVAVTLSDTTLGAHMQAYSELGAQSNHECMEVFTLLNMCAAMFSYLTLGQCTQMYFFMEEDPEHA